MPDSRQILIIGCGYVGRRAARRWLQAGAKVSALTRSPENAQQLRELGIQPIPGDVTQPDSLGLLPRSDLVLYAVGLDRRTGHSQREVYVNGLEHALERIASRTGRLVYVSSTSVYGQTLGEWVDEKSVCEPTTPNGSVCLEAEQLLSRFFSTGDHALAREAESHGNNAPANILRLAGIYGPGRLIARIATLTSGEPITGNPDAWLNLIHVEDAVSSIMACVERGEPGATYVVCDDRPVSRREYYETLATLVGAPKPDFAPIPEAERRQLNKRCSNRRLRDELQVELAFSDITTGLANAIK